MLIEVSELVKVLGWVVWGIHGPNLISKGPKSLVQRGQGLNKIRKSRNDRTPNLADRGFHVGRTFLIMDVLLPLILLLKFSFSNLERLRLHERVLVQPFS